MFTVTSAELLDADVIGMYRIRERDSVVALTDRPVA